MVKIKGKGKGMIAKERADSEGLAIGDDGAIYYRLKVRPASCNMIA